MSIWILFAYYIGNKYFYFSFIFVMEGFDKFWDKFLYISKPKAVYNKYYKENIFVYKIEQLFFQWLQQTIFVAHAFGATNITCC